MTHHYPNHPIINKHKPGTKEAIEDMHNMLYGNTDRIRQGEPVEVKPIKK